MSEPSIEPSALLIRFGEIFLKGRNRPFFERRLVDNTRRAIADLPGARLERLHGRQLAWPGESTMARLSAAVGKVFGVASSSPVLTTERSLEAIEAAAIAVASRERTRRGGTPTFKVESRRADKRFLPASPELSRLVGAAIVRELTLPVDVHRPDFTVHVEVGHDRAFVFAEIIPGPGGLPVGVTGRVELLLSGGIDSPVAGWLCQKRGCALGATYFHSPPFTGEGARDKVLSLARELASWQPGPLDVTVVPFADAQRALRDASGDGRLAVVLYRRMMLRVAERIARRRGAIALATGEALAQVASQTLENLSVIGQATSMTVLRPCIGHDKNETIALARRIGTFELSILPYDDCCPLFVPPHPETRARLEAVLDVESRLDIDALASACLVGAEVHRVR